MCGIFCSIWRDDENSTGNLEDCARYKSTIERRGPDYVAERWEKLPLEWKGSFLGSVLWMQGPRPVEQPCIDPDGNILLWNGDIFSGCLARDDVSDTQTLLNSLQTNKNVLETLKTVSGPYSVIYYQASERLLYFARDPIGRHSLLLHVTTTCNRVTLSSSASGHLDESIEVPAIGIFAFDLDASTFHLHPWNWPESRSENIVKNLETKLGIKIIVFDPLVADNGKTAILEPRAQDVSFFDPAFLTRENESLESFGSGNKNTDMIPGEKFKPEVLSSIMKKFSELPDVRARIERVLELLKNSIKLRVQKKPNYCKNCVPLALDGEKNECKHAKLGILFSGGLDSTILAALADEFVSREESIDLINVAFEKAKRIDSKMAGKNNSKNVTDLSVNFDVPDRKTGREALAELQKLRPWRTWNFVECNVTQEELQKHRLSRIRDLVFPLTTILDDSLGCALWFASRASGILSSAGKQYDSPCRVLLLGMGADELFGGYTRHRTTLRRGGWSALSEELGAELARISERNLGRDDRVVSDHGRQSRLPYLDDDFVRYVSSLEAWQRCNPIQTMPCGLGDKLLLRLVAYDIGLCHTATFPKRAFQFGSRIANSKQNAKDPSNWL